MQIKITQRELETLQLSIRTKLKNAGCIIHFPFQKLQQFLQVKWVIFDIFHVQCEQTFSANEYLFLSTAFRILHSSVCIDAVKYTKQDNCLWNINKMKMRHGIGKAIKIIPWLSPTWQKPAWSRWRCAKFVTSIAQI